MAVKAGVTKYIFVTGGVLSGVGKGITAASIGNILKARGLSVNIQKCDPYLNVDAGMLNPAEHGECFVTKDGAETDLDLGHYERFLDVELTQKSSVMSGRVLLSLIQDERKGKYLGKTVQVIPHFTNAIQEYIQSAAEGFDVHIVEIGGTVGDYESPAFIEAIRELSAKVGRANCLYVHVVYLPYLNTSKEFKTKPAQNAVRDLRSTGISPDMLVARCETSPNGSVKSKLSMFAGVEEDAIAILPNAKTVYEVPMTLEQVGWGKYITKKLNLPDKKPQHTSWKTMLTRATTEYKKTVKIGIVAKYLDNDDTYMSVIEALKSAAWKHEVSLDFDWVDAGAISSLPNAKKVLKKYDGVLVPGGFGTRGVEGKIYAAQYALKNKKPYLGICLGLQVSVIAAARLAGLKNANTTEIDPSSLDPVISTMLGQKGKENTGGTMRLGDYECKLEKGSLAEKVYGSSKIIERHRHRYECNNDYRTMYESWGIRASGTSPDGNLVEMIEGIKHPFFLATQAHPELKSRPNHSHPMFDGFISASIGKRGK